MRPKSPLFMFDETDVSFQIEDAIRHVLQSQTVYAPSYWYQEFDASILTRAPILDAMIRSHQKVRLTLEEAKTWTGPSKNDLIVEAYAQNGAEWAEYLYVELVDTPFNALMKAIVRQLADRIYYNSFGSHHINNFHIVTNTFDLKEAQEWGWIDGLRPELDHFLEVPIEFVTDLPSTTSTLSARTVTASIPATLSGLVGVRGESLYYNKQGFEIQSRARSPHVGDYDAVDIADIGEEEYPNWRSWGGHEEACEVLDLLQQGHEVALFNWPRWFVKVIRGLARDLEFTGTLTSCRMRITGDWQGVVLREPTFHTMPERGTPWQRSRRKDQ